MSFLTMEECSLYLPSRCLPRLLFDRLVAYLPQGFLFVNVSMFSLTLFVYTLMYIGKKFRVF